MPDTFLCLSNTAWSAISSMSAVSAVVVALFLHFSSQTKKINNLSTIIEKELKNNIALLEKSHHVQEGRLNGQVISKLNLMCPVLVNINISDWIENKQTIAEVSAERYMQYAEIMNRLESIKSHSIDTMENNGKSPFSVMIEEEVDKCLQILKEGKISV